MTHTTKRILLWGAVVLGLFLFLLLLTKLATSQSEGTQGTLEFNQEITVSEEHVKGNPEAAVTLIEYSDFQCPACASMYPLLKEAVGNYQEDIRMIYRHFPLRSIHPNAQLAAQASEAAALQGKFWEMHDALFNTQSQWSNQQDPEEFFVRLAASLGLDEEQFRNDLSSDEIRTKVNEDVASANDLRLNATPTIFINGVQYRFSSYEQLKQVLETEISNN